MYKFLVLIVVVAGVYAKPGYVGHYPGAVSHVSRFDIHDSQPIVGSYAPVAYAEPIVHGSIGYGSEYAGLGHAGYGHGAGYVTGHSGYGAGYGAGYGSGHGLGYGHGYPAAQSYSNRVDIHSHSTPVLAGPAYSGHGYGGYGLQSGLGYVNNIHGIHHDW